MTDRRAAPPPDPYSPRRRTALVLTGTGTAGAYHAGVLRALHEAGVKLDVVAGRGIGVLAALFAAIDGGQRLWDERGFWRADVVPRLYQWRGSLRLAALASLAAIAIVVLPLPAIAAGLIVFPIDFVLKMIGVSAASGLAEWYLQFAASAFAPEALPTWLPRIVLLVLGFAAFVGAVSAWLRISPRHLRGGALWRLVRPPLSATTAIDHAWTVMWDLLRGAAQLKQPERSD